MNVALLPVICNAGKVWLLYFADSAWFLTPVCFIPILRMVCWWHIFPHRYCLFMVIAYQKKNAKRNIKAVWFEKCAHKTMIIGELIFIQFCTHILQPNVCTKTYSFAYIFLYLMSLCAQTCMKISSLNKSSHSFVLIFVNQPSSTKHFPAFSCVCFLPVISSTVWMCLLSSSLWYCIFNYWKVLAGYWSGVLVP